MSMFIYEAILSTFTLALLAMFFGGQTVEEVETEIIGEVLDSIESVMVLWGPGVGFGIITVPKVVKKTKSAKKVGRTHRATRNRVRKNRAAKVAAARRVYGEKASEAAKAANAAVPKVAPVEPVKLEAPKSPVKRVVLPAPQRKAPVQGCALPKPTLRRKPVLPILREKQVNLATQRPTRVLKCEAALPALAMTAEEKAVAVKKVEAVAASIGVEVFKLAVKGQSFYDLDAGAILWDWDNILALNHELVHAVDHHSGWSLTARLSEFKELATPKSIALMEEAKTQMEAIGQWSPEEEVAYLLMSSTELFEILQATAAAVSSGSAVAPTSQAKEGKLENLFEMPDFSIEEKHLAEFLYKPATPAESKQEVCEALYAFLKEVKHPFIVDTSKIYNLDGVPKPLAAWYATQARCVRTVAFTKFNFGGESLTLPVVKMKDYDKVLNFMLKDGSEEEFDKVCEILINKENGGLTPVPSFYEWLASLKLDQLFKLFKICVPKAQIEGKTLTLKKGGQSTAVFNFEEATVRWGTITRQASTTIHAFDKAWNFQVIFFILAMNCAKMDAKEISKCLNGMSTMWSESNYGAKPRSNSPIAVNNREAGGTLSVETSGSLPFVRLSNGGGLTAATVDSYLNSGQAIFIDKNASKYVGGEKAANACGIGSASISELNAEVLSRSKEFLPKWMGEADANTRVLMTLLDASKSTKLLNRIGQSCHFTSAHLETYEESLLGFKTGSEVVRQGGFPVEVIMTNSSLCMGSGPVMTRPDFSIPAYITKKLVGQVNMLTLPKTRIDEVDGDVDVLAAQTQMALDGLVGKRFKPGQRVYSESGRPVVTYRGKEISCEVISGQVVRVLDEGGSYKTDYFNVEIEVKLDLSNEKYLKLRNYGIKATTHPYDVTVFNEDGSPYTAKWDIIFNLEATKGRASQIVLFANAHGGGVYDSQKGVLTMNDGREICLYDPNNEVYQWVQAHSRILRLQFPIAKSEWEAIQKFSKGMGTSMSELGVKVVAEHESYVVVEETVQALPGHNQVEVEVSSPVESVGSSAMTSEMLAVLSSLDEDAAETLYGENKAARDILHRLISMAEGKAEKVINLKAAGILAYLQTRFGSSQGKSDKEVLADWGSKVKSMTLAYGESRLTVDFEVVAGLMAFNSGEGVGVAHQLVSFLRSLGEGVKTSSLERTMSMLSAAYSGWVSTALSSKSFLKRYSRTANVLVNGKVKTTYSPLLNSSTLPVVGFNPKSDQVKMLVSDPVTGAYLPEYTFSKTLTEEEIRGQNFDYVLSVKKNEDGTAVVTFLNKEEIEKSLTVGLYRIPMVFPLFCSVKLDKSFGLAHCFVLASEWSAANEGDGDGDGYSSFNASRVGIDKAKAFSYNAALVSQAGYDWLYGGETTYGEFLMKPSSKAIRGNKNAGMYISFISFEDMKAVHHNVRSHYSFNVGTGYGVASNLAFRQAMAVKSLMSEELSEVQIKHRKSVTAATVYAWRCIYEDKGLGGFSAKNSIFFACLNYLAEGKKMGYLVLDEEGNVCGVNEKDNGNTLEDISVYLSTRLMKIFSLTKAETAEVAKVLVSARKLTAGFGRMERQGAPKNGNQQQLALYGVLRRIGQGNDPGAENTLEVDTEFANPEDPTPDSVFQVAQKHKAWELCQLSWMKEMVKGGSELMSQVADYKAKVAQAAKASESSWMM